MAPRKPINTSSVLILVDTYTSGCHTESLITAEVKHQKLPANKTFLLDVAEME